MEVTDLLTMEKAAAVISRLIAKNVLVKGGYLKGDLVGVLWTAGENHSLPAGRVDITRTAPAAFYQPRSRRDHGAISQGRRPGYRRESSQTIHHSSDPDQPRRGERLWSSELAQ